MNNKQFFELIRSLYSAMKCPGCGAVYDVEEIQFIGQIDGLFMMQMVCQKCALPISVNFYLKKEKELVSDLSKKERQLFAKKWQEPISTDEVIDFHQDIQVFNRNIAKLTNKKKR